MWKSNAFSICLKIPKRLSIYWENEYPNCIRVCMATHSWHIGWTALTQVGSSLRSELVIGVLWLYIILLNKSMKNSILITNDQENLLKQGFRLNNIKFNNLILLWITIIVILILSSTVSLYWYDYVRIYLSIKFFYYTLVSQDATTVLKPL